jgi:hypothetical protein
MTTNEFGDLVCNEEEYNLLKNTLEKFGIIVKLSASDGKRFDCYVRNPSQEVINLFCGEREKKLVKDITDGYMRF